MSEMAIELKEVSKSFDGKHVLNAFSARVEEGQTVCLMGSSGCGKTTLLRILAGLMPPDSGSIHGMSGKKLSMVFQEDRLLENFTVWRNLKLTAQSKFTRADAERALLAVGMEKSVLTQKVSLLSGGMKRRVAILRALAADYDVLLLDEPTSGLDESNKNAVIAYIKEQCRGKTAFWVTHDENEAASAADIIWRL